ncbi:acyltransferase [Algivirga pacifica]|uniref:Acyltransferase 3 domain-containing protein n=1 Tax=Algivirga pacifica TaxID=1162670 RepID=A0ABP9DJZ8_9BACT
MKSIKFFPGLNALRFIAAYLVVIHHAESVKESRGLPNLHEWTVFSLGGVAVSFFFVLSGFLITYLLLKEHKEYGGVSIQKFYMRRVIRIWPLYFLLVFIGLAIVPLLTQWFSVAYELPYKVSDVLWYYIFFMPFVVSAQYGYSLLYPLWSIGVEEVFYVLWAPVVRFLIKFLPPIFFMVIAIRLSWGYYYEFVDTTHPVMTKIATTFGMDAMAIGGLGAYFVFHTRRPIGSYRLFGTGAQLLLLGLLGVRFLFHETLANREGLLSGIYQWIFMTPVFGTVLMNGLFLWLILNISLNERRLFNVNYPFLEWLGSLSYGIYMYHLLVIFGIVYGIGGVLFEYSGWVSFVGYHGLIMIGTIGISYLSKHFFEDYFIGMRKYFVQKRKKEVKQSRVKR